MESEILAVISGNGKRFKYINLCIWLVGTLSILTNSIAQLLMKPSNSLIQF